ncbi:MAG: cytochrome c biogenesis protein ResB, partial [Bacteroidales bacterium]|nr:cytochrome c biogenesis protein ResB [Bacteroidales bacterium]
MTTFIRLAYLLLLAVLASATFVEWQCGTPFVHRYVYGSWWFAFLIAMVVVPGLILVVRRLRHCRPALLLHFSLAIVALGALLTRLTATDGLLHLRQGQSSTEFLSSGEPHRPVPLPVIVSLDSFQIVCYPHTDAPLDYVSHLRVDGRACRVSMNRVLSVDGYRFYQSSYDPDARGTILTVNHDPWGMTVSYAGYLLTIISFVLIMANPRGRFRRLLRGSAPVVLALLSLTSCSDSTPPHAPIPSPDKVERFSQLDIIYRDRHTPVDTYCFDFLLKVTGSTSFRGLSPQTVVLAWLTSPEEWQNVPMIRVKNESAARSFGLHPVDGYISAKSLFVPDDSYILSPYIRDADKAALDINDRLQAIIALTDGTAFRLAPEPIPSFRRSVEVGYARLRPVALLFKFQLFVGLLLLFLVMRATLRGHPVPSRLFAILSILSAASQAAALAIRGYIARAWPLANGYETMLFLALVIVLVSLVLGRRHALLAAACRVDGQHHAVAAGAQLVFHGAAVGRGIFEVLQLQQDVDHFAHGIFDIMGILIHTAARGRILLQHAGRHGVQRLLILLPGNELVLIHAAQNVIRAIVGDGNVIDALLGAGVEIAAGIVVIGAVAGAGEHGALAQG